jgi:anti-anti-sigma factor
MGNDEHCQLFDAAPPSPYTDRYSASVGLSNPSYVSLDILQGRKMSRILLVEDSPTQTRIVSGSLAKTEYQLESVTRLTDAIQRVGGESFGAVVLDLSLPDSNGLSTYLRMQAASPSTPIVVLTSTDDEELALEMLRNGAQDYLIKGEVTSEWIVRSIRYAVERSLAAQSQRGGTLIAAADRELQLQFEQVGDVAVLRINERRLFGEDLVEQLSSRLFKLVDEDSYRKFVLNCDKVDYISNSVLSKLLLWDQRIRQHQGSMRICNLRPEVLDQLKARRQLAQFDICIDESTAIQGF